MQRLGMEEGVPSSTGWFRGRLSAQKQVEAQNFGVRKHLLEYDDVMNKQRESVYAAARSPGRVDPPHRGRDRQHEGLPDGAGRGDPRGHRRALRGKAGRRRGVRYSQQSFASRACSASIHELGALQLDSKNTDEITDAVWDRKEGYLRRNNPSGPNS